MVDLNFNNLQDNVNATEEPTLRVHSIHSRENIIGDSTSGVQTRNQVAQASSSSCLYAAFKESGIQSTVQHECFVSQVEPSGYRLALKDPS